VTRVNHAPGVPAPRPVRRRLPPSRRAGALAAPILAGALALAGCSSNSSPDPSTLGRVAIPTAPASPLVPTASVGHAQLVAIGDSVLVVLPGGARALATASGPSLDTPTAAGATAAKTVTGTLTITVTAQQGSVPVQASALSVIDELGHQVAVSADRPSAAATAGHPATVHLRGVFFAGDTSVTWKLAGRPVATWDFQVELD
jgi:hypothetical protein